VLAVVTQDAMLTYAVPEFSAEYAATVAVEDAADSYSAGRVDVVERATGKPLLRVEGHALPLEPGPDVVIHADFDFDGRPDLAIRDGNNSCYNGPSYQVFLRRGKSFKQSAAFTELAQEYCGMFEVDAAHKQLGTYTKSGCCYHGFQSFDVVRGQPRLLEEISEDRSLYPAYVRTTRHSRGSPEQVELNLDVMDDSGATLVLAFDIVGKPERHVEVFAVDGQLDYALVHGPGREVELSYRVHVAPTAATASAAPFVWNAADRELSFQNGAYRYVIHDSKQRLGVSVEHGDQHSFLAGNPTSRIGDLAELESLELENATVAPAP
jgi:hypothetical protein